jgi:hypothetical protein
VERDPAPITDIRQVTPAWLTGALRAAQVLDDAVVTAVRFEEPWRTSFSVVTRVHAAYSRAVTAPASFFLKFSQAVRPVSVPERGWEVLFYRSVAPLVAGNALVRCYDAVFSPQEQRLHLLLEDLTETHFPEMPSHLPPTYATCERIVAALAQIHASFWSRPPFHLSGQGVLTESDLQQRVQMLSERTNAFMAMLGDRLGDERRAIYREVLAALPLLFRRLMSPHGMTVVHDDIHIGNFLYPHNPARDHVRVIDWQTWNTDLAVKDLAHMMAYFWFPELRKRWEEPLLRAYHARLQELGVQDYGWEALYDDYRLCVIRKLFHPAWQWETGDVATKWWLHLERVMLAYQDLGCRELLG